MSHDSRLLNQHKQVLFKLIQQAEFDPVDFDILDVDYREPAPRIGLVDCRVSQVLHKVSQYYFIFGGLHLEWSPDILQRINGVECPFDQWTSRVDLFQRWLDALRREVTTVDPWQVLQGQQSIQTLLLSPQQGREQFDRKERKEIVARIAAAESEFKNANPLPDEQWQHIKDSLDYLRAASERVTKKDFLLLVMGQCASLALNNIDANTIRALWMAMCDALAPIYGQMLRLLPS